MSESLMKEVRKNNIRVCTLTPSTIESDMTIELGIANKDSQDSVLQPEDFAQWNYYIRLDIRLRDLELHKLTLNHEETTQKLQYII